MTAEKIVRADIRSLLRDELLTRFDAWQQPAYRVDQLLQWLYPRKATSWEIMTNLPKALRQELTGAFTLQTLKLVQVQGGDDTTRKFLWRLHDGALVESVLIPANPALYGEASDRHTLCVSTQVGCAYGCRFCASGLDGWKRNLTADEIVEQILAVERWHEERNAAARPRTAPPVGGDEPASADQAQGPGPARVPPNTRLINNLVIMGMGEPLANYANLLQALRILNAPWGGGIGARKITISTSGLVPQIRQLAEEPLQFRLAISLHGATDETRDKIMPVNRKYPLAELAAACEDYQKRKDRMITFEYILIDGVNDDPSETKPLAALARRLNAKVNLIPYNAVEGLPWKRPSEAAQEVFLARLERHHITATLRREKGHDIDAACGQLRLRVERAGVVETSTAIGRHPVSSTSAPAPTRGPAPSPRTRPDRSRPDRSRPDRTRPDHSRPDHTRPDHTRPNRSRSDRSRPDRSRPDRSRPDRSRSDRSRPDRSRPDSSRPSRAERGPAPDGSPRRHSGSRPDRRTARDFRNDASPGSKGPPRDFKGASDSRKPFTPRPPARGPRRSGPRQRPH